jgi:hypothetical protein
LYDREVPPIKGRQRFDPKTLGSGHDGRVDRPEREIAVLPDEFANAQPVTGVYGLDGERPARDIADKPHLGLRADASREQICDLGDCQDGDDQRSRMRLQQLKACAVMSVVGIDVRVEGP